MKLVAKLVAVWAVCGFSSGTAFGQVPTWDAKGSGPLPKQGIACLDVAPDGTIVVGTIAPAGHPNVISLDANGKVLTKDAVGQRWIG